MSQFPLARIRDFVRSVVPFESLEPQELDQLVRHMDIAYFPRGEVVVRQGGEPARHLYIIHSGSVKLTSADDNGREVLVDVRGEGDTFGALSLLHGEEGHFSVIAQEDLLTFLLPGEQFLHLVETHPTFQRHFGFSLASDRHSIRALTDSLLVQMTGTETLGEMAAQMHNRVEELMSRRVVSCSPHTTVREAALTMSRHKVGSIVVVDQAGRPVGVVTDTDLRTRVLAAGLSGHTPVEVIMSSPVRTISPRAFAFEAMLEMTRQGVHHLLVADGGRLLGVISDHDINVITGSSPVGLVSRIDKVSSRTELTRLPRRIYRMLHMTLRLGVSAEYLLDLLAEFNDRLTVRLIQLTEHEMLSEGLGPPPTDFAWLSLGAAGRREPIPPVVQEHVLAYADLPPAEEEHARKWFLELARRVRRGLEECGLAPGPEHLLADRPDGCRGLDQWRDIYLGWVRHPVPETLARVAPCFDFTPVYENGHVGQGLRRAVFEAIERNRIFLRILARSTFSNQIPLGFLRQFVVEKNGEYAAQLDLDRKVLIPMVDAARVLALDQRIEATSTFDRLALAAGRGLLTERLAADLHEAFSFVALLKIARYLEAKAQDQEPESTVDPAQLTRVQRKMLKDTFAVVEELQGLMKRRYGAPLGTG